MPRTSALSTRISDWLSRVTSTSRRNLVALAIATLGLVLVPVAYQDYKMFLSYGPGGVPYNVLGWLGVSLVLAPLGSEMFSVDEYDRNPDKRSWLPDDEPIPRREGGRPRVGPHVVPQRQLNQIPGDEMKQVSSVCTDFLFRLLFIHFCSDNIYCAFEILQVNEALYYRNSLPPSARFMKKISTS